MKLRNRTAAAIAAVLALGAVTIGSPPPEADASPSIIKFATAGDSITINKTPAMWWRQWDSTTIRKTSPGGFAKSGYTSGQVLKAIPADIPHADVLVIVLGANDMRLGVPVTTVLSNFKRIADKVGAPRVVLAATPPSNLTSTRRCPDRGCRTAQFVLNRAMSTFAYKHGWLFVDPWLKVRQVNNGWTKTYTYDGRHPTFVASEIAKNRLEQAIRIAYKGTL
jgi:hypothetical protein